MKIFGIMLVAVLLVGIGGYFLLYGMPGSDDVAQMEEEVMTDESDTVEDAMEEEEVENEKETILGQSVDGRDIVAYHYGTGEKELLFVGGVHGGYSWNTALVGYELMDYLEENPSAIPENIRVTVVPVLNPDGLEKFIGTAGVFTKEDALASTIDSKTARFNAHVVDLNRNFDCDWESTGTWQNQDVDGGDAPFSEPESAAIRDYVAVHIPAAAVVWYSSAGGVFASSCHNGVSSETRAITNLYADAAGYKAYEEFDFYEITGDMVNWLAKENIPAISVLLTTHSDTEWSKNQKGIEALFAHYAE